MKIAFIVKGTIKNKKAFQQSITQLPSLGIENYNVFETQHPGHAIELSEKAVYDSYSHIISVGGDGTNNEVLNGMLKAAHKEEATPVFGCLPYGSANDFSRTSKSRQEINLLAKALLNKKPLTIDIGKAEFKSKNGGSATRYFLNIADIGMGGYALEKMEKMSDFGGPDVKFFRGILSALISYKKSVIKCYNSKFQWQGKTMLMVFANAKYFGNGLCVAPNAALNDGKLQMIIFGDVSTFDYLKNLGNLKKGLKIEHPEVSYHEVTDITIENEVPCAIDMDGELVGYGPAKFSVVPGAIKFISLDT